MSLRVCSGPQQTRLLSSYYRLRGTSDNVGVRILEAEDCGLIDREMYDEGDRFKIEES
jgi:hypothetical protein